MADKTLDVLIRTRAELEGAKSAADALERDIGKAKALGLEYGHLEEQLKKAQGYMADFKSANKENSDELGKAADGTSALGDKTEDAGKKLKLFSGHGRELRKVIGELSRDFPLAGIALRAFVSPIGAALTVAVILFRTIKGHLDEVNKELDDMGANAAKAVIDIQAAQRAASDELRRGLADYDEWQKKISENSKKAQDDLKIELEAIKDQTAATLDQIEAQKQLALAKLRATPGITPEQLAVGEAKIESQFEAATNTTKEKGAESELIPIQKARGAAETKASTARQEVEAAKPAALTSDEAKARKIQLGKIPDEIKDDKEQEKFFTDKKDGAVAKDDRKQIEYWRHEAARFKLMSESEYNSKEIRKNAAGWMTDAEQKASTLEAGLPENRAKFYKDSADESAKQFDALKFTDDAAKKRLSDAEEKYATALEELRQLANQEIAAKKKLADAKKQDAVIFETHEQTRAVEANDKALKALTEKRDKAQKKIQDASEKNVKSNGAEPGPTPAEISELNALNEQIKKFTPPAPAKPPEPPPTWRQPLPEKPTPQGPPKPIVDPFHQTPVDPNAPPSDFFKQTPVDPNAPSSDFFKENRRQQDSGKKPDAKEVTDAASDASDHFSEYHQEIKSGFMALAQNVAAQTKDLKEFKKDVERALKQTALP